MRLNKSLKCPAKTCGFNVNPFIIRKQAKGSPYVLECPFCGETWEWKDTSDS